jgi:6-phosphogluconolactonase
MQVDVVATPELAARQGALHLAEALRAGIRDRDRACLALSGGASPVPLFRELAQLDLDWSAVHVFQVDERVVPRGDPARNLTTIEQVLVREGPLPAERLHAMPVEADDLAAAAAAYGERLAEFAGTPIELDAIHLGLGADGHTASLFPGDATTQVTDRSVVVTGEHAGYRRLTLTYPVLNAARRVVWFAVGPGKAVVVQGLAAGTLKAPAGGVNRAMAVLVADAAGGGALPTT